MPSADGLDRVIGYFRVSSEAQVDGFSFESAERLFLQYAQRYGWKSHDCYREKGSGESISGRPTMQSILAEIEKGGVSALWVKDMDRLHRNVRDGEYIKSTLVDSNTLLIVDNEVLDLSEDSAEFKYGIGSVMSAAEKRRIRRRMVSGKETSANAGNKASGADVYGYRTVYRVHGSKRWAGKYEPHPDQAEVVREIYQLALQGLSIRAISAELFRRGIPCPKGKTATNPLGEWSPTMIKNILSNTVYLGIYTFRKQLVAKDKDGKLYRTKERGDRIVAGTRDNPNHPAIIDPAVFDAVRAHMAAKGTRPESRCYMATGILHCTCGAPMNVKYSTLHNRSSVAKYVCSNNPKCREPRLHAGEWNRMLWAELLKLLRKPQMISRLVLKPVDADDAIKREMESLQRDRDKCIQKRSNYQEQQAEGYMTLQELGPKLADLNRRLQAIESDMRALQNRLNNSAAHDQDVVRLIHVLKGLYTPQRFTPEQQVQLFRSIVQTVRVNDANFEITLRTKVTSNLTGKHLQEKRAQRTVNKQNESLTQHCVTVLLLRNRCWDQVKEKAAAAGVDATV